VFEQLPVRNRVSWSALISGYVQQGQGQEALKRFKQMQDEGVSPDAITFASILKACGTSGAIEQGKQIHDEILSKGLLENDFVLCSALVDMYVECGFLRKAQQILIEHHIRSTPCWNALIIGCVERGQDNEALNCFKAMQSEGVISNETTLTWVLKACAGTGAVDKGEEIHDVILRRGLFKEDSVLGNALINMYAKLGKLAKARQVLEELPFRNVMAWNAIIGGYLQHGQCIEAMNCVNLMQADGVDPDTVTFVSILNACSHAGLSDEAQAIFENMTRNYGIAPNVEHHTCIVAAVACAGHFDKAVSIISAMPSSNHEIWLALLASCRKWENVRLGSVAFDQIIQMDPCCPTAHVLMATIFAAAGMHEDANSIKSFRRKMSTEFRSADFLQQL
jgi:pentatricopeptide repeat protein